jgi:hypothetical protein
MAENKLTVKPCPRCSHEHEYTIEIITRMVMGFMLRRSPTPPPAPRRKSVRVAAPCPEKNDSFAVTLTLNEYEDAPIEKVSLTLVLPAKQD